MRLVIAEKPSVAQSIASVLGADQHRDGYVEGGGYLVSWCFGHLAELADASAYNADYAKWSMNDLPIIPYNFRFTIRGDKRKQFDILRDLLRREDVSEVINACDAGREGELIFRTVYCLAGCSKPMKRLWISSMEDDAIRAGFQSLHPGQDYDGLHQSALCRAKADWLVGINATRYFSLTYGCKLNIGRVMSPTLALLVQREADISAFQPEPFYTVGLGFGAVSERMRDRKAALSLAAACKGAEATVRSVERKERTEKAPALYDLTTLQRDANRLLGYTAQQTLDYLQALYEKKLCTYPRTDSRFLTDDMESGVSELVAAASTICEAEVPGEVHAHQVCNQSITLRAGMSEVQTVSAAVHEIAHAKLHNYEKMAELADDGETVLAPGEKDRNTEEVEAESISYAVCQYYGIETAENSFGYIATWSQGKELKELRASLETINKTASGLITDIDRHFKDICKERGVDLTAEAEQTAPIEEPPTPEPELPETQEEVPHMELPLDEYPMPDASLTMADLEACNYLDGDMLPLSHDEAVQLAEKDMSVYAIVDGEAQMVFDRDDIDAQTSGTIFAVSREEWEQSPEFHELVMDRLNHQEQREQAFLSHDGDCFAIYQVKQDDTFARMRFLSVDALERTGVGVYRSNYDLVYSGTLAENATVETLYEKFNIDRPADYHTHSMSVSDIVAIKRDSAVSCHYCDSFGFKEIPGFIQQENPLKNAEMAMEDDYGMIDGVINNGKSPTVAELEQQARSGQPISLMNLAEAVHRERSGKKSVVEKLKAQPKQERKKSAPKKSAEKEL